MKKVATMTYLSKENHDYLEGLAGKYQRTKTYILNQMIEASRENKKLKLEKHIPDYVKKAEAWKAKVGNNACDESEYK